MKLQHFQESIRLVIALLLIGAGISTSVPWKSLKTNFSQLTMDVADDDQDMDDERDRDDERGEDDERESKAIERDYLGMQHSLQLTHERSGLWHAIDLQAILAPVIDLQVPPPQQFC